MSIGNTPNNKKQKRSPEQMSQYLIQEKGIIQAIFSVQTKLGECRNHTEEVYWTNVLRLLRKAW